jgi:hypothetical protein
MSPAARRARKDERIPVAREIALPRTGPRSRVIAALAAAWPALRALWLLALAGLLALGIGPALVPAGRRPSILLDPQTSGLASHLPATPILLAVITLIALGTWYTFLASRLRRRFRRIRLMDTYLLARARRIDPARFVPRYVASVYAPRRDRATADDAEAAARRAVRAAMKRDPTSPLAPLGVCIYGRSMQGKTRLALELMRSELATWTVVRWPHDPGTPFDFSRLRRRNVVLWLDGAHEFATPAVAATLNDLPRRFATLGMRLVVVATCLDGLAETRTRVHLASLLDRLEPVRLADLTPAEADQVVAALAKTGTEAYRDHFDGTPGSLLLAPRRMRKERYPALSEDARRVLRALKLLHSARIYAYPTARVRALAHDLFDLVPTSWPAACRDLERTGFVRVRRPIARVDATLEPASGAYLDQAVPDYLLSNAQPSDDWPWLLESFERHGDTYGLTTLGNAFTEPVTGNGPLLPYAPRIEKQRGVLCFRAALEACAVEAEPYAWATAQLELANALSERAKLSEGLLRADFWRQALAAYRAAMEVFTPDAAQAHWALAQLGMTCAYENRGADALLEGETDNACMHFRAARRHARCALSFYTPETDPTHHREVLDMRESVEQAMKELGAYSG